MARRIRDILEERRSGSFVGRVSALEALGAMLADALPIVTYVYGLPGIGKSTLLERFLAEARAGGAGAVALDCRSIEPTETGVLRVLEAELNVPLHTIEETATQLGGLGKRVLLAFDHFEYLAIVETWLRQELIPALPDNVRIVLASRQPPSPPWVTFPEWLGLFKSYRLEELADDEAIELLRNAGVVGEDAHNINRAVRGHPLALKLAAAAAQDRPGFDIPPSDLPAVMTKLAELYLHDVSDPAVREAVAVAAVVRRLTVPLLDLMIPQVPARELYDRLLQLSIVEVHTDGLSMHESVKAVIEAAMEAADPEVARSFRRLAWRHIRDCMQRAARGELWRYTADALYLFPKDSMLHQSFNPPHELPWVAEPARASDGDAIRRITQKYDGREMQAAIEAWWQAMPRSFTVARDPQGGVQGYTIIVESGLVPADLAKHDPVVATWRRHLREHPMPEGQKAIFNRRQLCDDVGEHCSPTSWVLWLHLFRSFIELRPELRRWYSSMHDTAYWSGFNRALTIDVDAEPSAVLDGRAYDMEILDFGSGSVDGWIAARLADQLGIGSSQVLDPGTRELTIDGTRTGLTAKEFALLQYLWRNEGRAVTRDELLDDVWAGGLEENSNVVDAVVWSLRKKLGSLATALETVRGVGYRFRPGFHGLISAS